MNDNDWSAPVPMPPSGVFPVVCPHVGCIEVPGHDSAHTDGMSSWRYFPPPVLMDGSCGVVFGCIRAPHDDGEHLMSTGSVSGPHNVWESRLRH